MRHKQKVLKSEFDWMGSKDMKVGCLYTNGTRFRTEAWAFVPTEENKSYWQPAGGERRSWITETLYLPEGETYMYLGSVRSSGGWSIAYKLLYKSEILYTSDYVRHKLVKSVP